MGAIVCEVERWESEEFEINGAGFFARGVNAREKRCCPVCHSIIYSRRHKLCGVCGEKLPADCLFSADQAHSVEVLLTEERDRHRKWLDRFCDSSRPSAWLMS
jgi:hypothetical protein